MFPKKASGDADKLDNDGPQLIARITTTEDGRPQCTIYPESAKDERTTTRWITASEDSYIELDPTH